MTAKHIYLTRIAPLRDSRVCGGGRSFAGATGSTDDLDLVRRCAQRDPDALREIVQRYQQRLSAFLSRLLESREDTEEAVQDVFLRVWQQADRFEGRASFATWLYRIAANVACDLLRRRKAQSRLIPTADSRGPMEWPNVAVSAEEQALAGLEQEERARQLQQALSTLRPDDRLLLVLYYAEEMGYDEIGQVTGHSRPVLKMRLLRARQRLRSAMSDPAAGLAE